MQISVWMIDKYILPPTEEYTFASLVLSFWSLLQSISLQALNLNEEK